MNWNYFHFPPVALVGRERLHRVLRRMPNPAASKGLIIILIKLYSPTQSITIIRVSLKQYQRSGTMPNPMDKYPVPHTDGNLNKASQTPAQPSHV